jgi:hypothetical protein
MTKIEAHFSGIHTESNRLPWKETTSGFVIRISFDIRHLAFVICASFAETENPLLITPQRVVLWLWLV